MRRILFLGIALVAAGCAAVPPAPPAADPIVQAPPPNLYWVPHSGAEGYDLVFKEVLATLVENGFVIRSANRYDGIIETEPRIAPGIGRFLSPGSPLAYERLLATYQTYRHRAIAKIHPAENDGFFIQITVFRELEDLPRPVRSTAGAAFFQMDNDVNRQFEIIDPTIFESNWIPRGRDIAFEQAILERLKSRL